MELEERQTTPQSSCGVPQYELQPSPDAALDLLDVLFDPVAVTEAVRDDSGRIIDFRLLYANTAAVDLTGRAMSELVGKTALSLYPNMDTPQLFDTWAEVVEKRIPRSTRGISYRTQIDGMPAGGYFDVGAVPYGDGCLLTWRDMTIEHHLQQELTKALSVHEGPGPVAAVSEYHREVVGALRDALLPRQFEEAADVSLGFSHQPAERVDGTGGVSLGGDWYDAFVVGEKFVTVIGDVTGHDVSACVVMSQLRNALRAYARMGMGPAATLQETNRFIRDLLINATATALCIELDPRTGAVTWAQAGHFAPLVRRSSGVQIPHRPEGVMLGVLDDGQYGETGLQLESGDLLLSFSDGLIETRKHNLEQSLCNLAGLVNASDRINPQEVCDYVLRHAIENRDVQDDASVLALRWRA